jgi:RNase P subunit RPR2
MNCSLPPLLASKTNPLVNRPNVLVREKIRAFFCRLCRRPFTQAAHLRTHEKRKEHQLRLMNGMVAAMTISSSTTTTIDNDN